MRRTLTAGALVALSAAVIAVVTIRVAANTSIADATREHRFSLLEYELSHLPNHWLTQVAEWFDGSEEDEEAILARWFESRPANDANRVERILERRLSEAIRAAGLATPLPLFKHQHVVWPPVDIEFKPPLRVLAVSPREEIRLTASVLLEAELPRGDFAAIESAIEADRQRSALVTTVGGVALYPALVVSTRDYRSALQLIAHEWSHHYLAFYPLGQAYARSGTMRTINETASDIVGDELAELTTARYPQPLSAAARAEAAAREAIRSATDPILRTLRLEVDALLEQGEIAAAEALMEETRLRLVEMGRNIRRINQAYFAFSGAYGANPASTTPWGERLFALRDRAGSLADFLGLIREIGNDAEAEGLFNP